MEIQRGEGKRKRLEGSSEASAGEGVGNSVKSIIVCGVRSELESVPDSENNRLYEIYEFFRIDDIHAEINENESPNLRHCFETMASCYDFGAIFQVDKRIYFIGSLFMTKHPVFDSVTVENTGESVSCSNGMSCVNIFEDDPSARPCWTSCGHPPTYGFLASVTLRGKIYTLADAYLERPIVYDPVAAVWFDCEAKAPSEIEMFRLTGKMLPDDANGRIFIHLYDPELLTSALYVWYPEGRDSASSWLCIEPTMGRRYWMKKPTYADQDLIFFYLRKTQDLFRVYDVGARKWLELEWRKLFPRFLERNVKAKSMFYLGNSQLCLAISTYVGDLEFTNPYGCKITLVVFEYCKQCTIPSEAARVTMNYLYTKHFDAQGIVEPVEFIPLV